MAENYLLVDCCNNGSGFVLNLNEAASTDRGLVRFRGKFQEAESINKNKRLYPYNVLDESVKKLKEAVKSRGLIGELDHPCLLDKNFQVLTPKGFKNFENIRAGDEVYSRVNGQMVASKVEAVIDEPYDGKAYHVKGRAIDCEFTSPHKFLMCKRGKGDEYYATLDEIHHNRNKYNHDYIPKTANWEGNNQTTITIPGTNRERLKYADQDLKIETMKFVTFLGLYLSEGCIKKETNRIEIAQKNKYGRILVKHLLSNFHPEIEWKETKNGFYANDARLCDYLKPLGNCYNKYIPEEIKQLSSRYLETLVAAFAVGDGRMLKSNDGKNCYNLKEGINSYHEAKSLVSSLDLGTFSRLSVFTVSSQLIDDLHECIVKCGWSAAKSKITDKEDYRFAGRLIRASNKKPLYNLNLSRSKGIYMDVRHVKTVEKNHTGRIYCLKTEHGNFYMRYKGKSFWTGNCDSIIHFEKASHVITKLWWEGNSLMGEGEILGTPHGKILKTLIENGVRVGISSRGVGNGKVNEDGILVIGESYKLITFDAVADPSTFAAFQEKVSNKSESVKPMPQNSHEHSIKNEGTSINKISKEALIACLGGVIKTQTSNIKERLG